MKKRSGFVSNSSSASFIIGNVEDPLLIKALESIDQKTTPHIKEVAYQMLDKSDRKKMLKWLDSIPDDVKYIAFNSINYETEIFEIPSCILVLTCNNEWFSWENAFEMIKSSYGSSYQGIEETDLYEQLVMDSEYLDSRDYKFNELSEEAYLTLSMEKISKDLGPAAYIGKKGVILYEDEKRICIK